MTDSNTNAAPEQAVYTDGGARIDMTRIRKNLPELADLFALASSAAETYRAHVRAVAEAAGMRPAVLARYIRAVASDKLAQQRADAEQLQLLFDEVETHD